MKRSRSSHAKVTQQQELNPMKTGWGSVLCVGLFFCSSHRQSLPAPEIQLARQVSDVRSPPGRSSASEHIYYSQGLQSAGSYRSHVLPRQRMSRRQAEGE